MKSAIRNKHIPHNSDCIPRRHGIIGSVSPDFRLPVLISQLYQKLRRLLCANIGIDATVFRTESGSCTLIRSPLGMLSKR
jgi:hypothetical protein